MPNKNLCSKCNKKHFPPTGKKCKYLKRGLVNTDNDIHVMPHGIIPVLKSKKNMGTHDVLSDSSSAEEEQSMQLQILQELKQMNSRLDAVEDRMTSGETSQQQKRKHKPV